MKCAVFIFAFGLLCACASSHDKRAETPVASVDVARDYKNENSYFYFLLSQLKPSGTTPDEIALYLKTAIEKDRKSGFLWQIKAYNEAQDGDIDAAKASAEEALARNPKDPDTLFLLGKIASFEKKPILAESYFEKALAAEPANEEVYHFLAREYYGEKDMHSAKITLNRCLNALPNSLGCLYYLGSIALEDGDEETAVRSFETIAALYPDQIKALQTLVEIYVKREDYESALEVLKKIFRLTPDDVGVQIRLGWLYYETGNADYAIAVFEKIRDGFPDSDRVNYFLALLYAEKKLPEKALAAYAKVPADSTFFKKAIVQQIAILTDQERTGEIPTVLIGHLKGVSDPWLYQLLGWTLVDAEDNDAAIRYLSEGIKRFGNDEDLLFQRAIAFERENKWNEAQLDLSTLIANFPNSAKAYNFWAYSLAERGGDLAQALDYAQKANTLAPNKAHILDTLGWIHFKLGDVDSALNFLGQAVKLQKEEPTILEHLGDIYASQQDPKRAEAYYTQSLAVLQALQRKTALQLQQIAAIEKKLAEILN